MSTEEVNLNPKSWSFIENRERYGVYSSFGRTKKLSILLESTYVSDRKKSSSKVQLVNIEDILKNVTIFVQLLNHSTGKGLAERN